MSTRGRQGLLRQPTRFTVRLPRDVARFVHQRAAAWGVTPTTAAARLVEEAARIDVEHQHAALLEAAVEDTIRQALGTQLGRIGDLCARAALHSDETRRLLRPVLTRALGEDQARTARREAHSAAWQQLREPLAAPPKGDGAWPAAPTPS